MLSSTPWKMITNVVSFVEMPTLIQNDLLPCKYFVTLQKLYQNMWSLDSTGSWQQAALRTWLMAHGPARGKSCDRIASLYIWHWKWKGHGTCRQLQACAFAWWKSKALRTNFAKSCPEFTHSTPLCTMTWIQDTHLTKCRKGWLWSVAISYKRIEHLIWIWWLCGPVWCWLYC